MAGISERVRLALEDIESDNLQLVYARIADYLFEDGEISESEFMAAYNKYRSKRGQRSYEN